MSHWGFMQFHWNPCVGRYLLIWPNGPKSNDPKSRPYEFAQTTRPTWSMCRTHMYLILVYLQDTQLTISYMWSTSKWYVDVHNQEAKHTGDTLKNNKSFLLFRSLAAKLNSYRYLVPGRCQRSQSVRVLHSKDLIFFSFQPTHGETN